MTQRNRSGWLRHMLIIGLALLLIAPGLPRAAGQDDPPTEEPEVDGPPFSLPLKLIPGVLRSTSVRLCAPCALNISWRMTE